MGRARIQEQALYRCTGEKSSARKLGRAVLCGVLLCALCLAVLCALCTWESCALLQAPPPWALRLQGVPTPDFLFSQKLLENVEVEVPCVQIGQTSVSVCHLRLASQQQICGCFFKCYSNLALGIKCIS